MPVYRCGVWPQLGVDFVVCSYPEPLVPQFPPDGAGPGAKPQSGRAADGITRIGGAIAPPPRLRALCVGFHAGERLWEGTCFPRQHWPHAPFQILFVILHFPSDPFTSRDVMNENE